MTSPLAESISDDARKEFANLLNRVASSEEHIILTRHGEPLAALVSAQRLEELEAIEDVMDARAADQALEEGEFVDADAFFAEMDEAR